VRYVPRERRRTLVCPPMTYGSLHTRAGVPPFAKVFRDVSISSASQKSSAASFGALAACALVSASATAQSPAETTTPPNFGQNDVKPLLTDHGVGVQIYKCKRGEDHRLTWIVRDPLATLINDGKTGQHFAGPIWSFNGGEEIVGKVLKTAPGATSKDIPVLELPVVAHWGDGVLKDVQIVLRLNTHGGVLAGPCVSQGSIRLKPYSADYVFVP